MSRVQVSTALVSTVLFHPSRKSRLVAFEARGSVSMAMLQLAGCFVDSVLEFAVPSP